MAKISLISWRHREKRLPETEAQRRARARELSTDSNGPCSSVEGLDVLSAVSSVELSECAGEHLTEALDALSLRCPPTAEEALDVRAESYISVDLSPEQSSALHALPLFSTVSEENVPHLLLQLRKGQDYRGMTLQFARHTQVIPEMISLKEVCCQLKIGRRTIMQLIRRQELRCYRITHRHRFTIEDIKKYLERIVTN